MDSIKFDLKDLTKNLPAQRKEYVLSALFLFPEMLILYVSDIMEAIIFTRRHGQHNVMNAARVKPSLLNVYRLGEVMVVGSPRRPNFPLRLVTTGFVKFSSLAEPVLTDRGRPAYVKEIGIQVVSQEWERNMACLYDAFHRAGVETLHVGTFFNQIVFSTRPKFADKDSQREFESYLTHVHDFLTYII